MRTLHVCVLFVGIGLTACSRPEGPSARAVDDYLARTGAHPATAAPLPSATPTYATRVALTVESAAGLPDTDGGPGETDPYVIVDYDGQRFETGVVEGSLDPVWGDSFILDLRPGGVLTLSLMDEDAMASDDKLGVVSLPLDPLAVGETRPLEVPFRNGEGGTLKITLVGMAKP